MNHELARKTNMIDKYLLDELNEQDRAAFEEHMFDCQECASQVKNDFAMLNSLREVLREEADRPATQTVHRGTSGWREWFRPVVWAPTFAAAALAVVVGYQNFVSIPAMVQPQVFESKPISAATRGAATANTVTVKAGAAILPLSFEVFSPQVYPAYVCEFSAAGKTVTTIDCGNHTTAEFTLNLLIPSAKFPPGEYTMILRPAADKQVEISRYSLAIQTR